jgi:butyrate kinase
MWNWAFYNFNGSKEAETLYRAIGKYAPTGLEKEHYMQGSVLNILGKSNTEARDAANALVAGDRKGYNVIRNRMLNQMAKEPGGRRPGLAGRVDTKILAQLPSRRALRRAPVGKEVDIIRSRMTPDEKKLWDREQNILRARN